jgi:hypothetical protein
MAAYLEANAPEWVHRTPTGGRQTTDIARDIVAVTGWSGVSGLAAVREPLGGVEA